MSDSTGLIDRDRLGDRVVETLSRGGWGNPDVTLVEFDGRLVVVKDFAVRPAWVRAGIARWLTSREIKAYRALADVEAVPRLIGRVDSIAFVTEYRPGQALSRSLAGRLPPDFMEQLRAAVRAMHERGVVHLDLRHRSNVLAGDDGRPVLLDFASAVCFGRGARWRRLAVRWLGAVDRMALAKWAERLAGPG